ncbi:aminotransferase class III-fold pyridoxal phosphate-dependent enzyme [Bradyrhizobium sp. CW9]|uniref:aminotransferase class III-fold pyridoxal phosphate-dependent enzyme n=1 Tax=Bradyrhizobium sp. CW9 TaxID=2782689 RepID=UPI0020983312|nr:aminotransferase class III-fold pyridoxal phosphate-dependent enzyme [Bradyrhizobium sp. CW9]
MRNATWFAPHPPYAAKGRGCFVEDLDGRQLLDSANNFFSLVHGHAFAPVVAIRAAAGDGTAFGLPTEKEIALAELISGRSPRCEQVRFCTSGTEAVMFAIKGARALTGRSALAKFEGAYHGSYDWVEVSLAPEPAAWDDESGNPASIGGSKGAPKHVCRTLSSCLGTIQFDAPPSSPSKAPVWQPSSSTLFLRALGWCRYRRRWSR